PDVVALGIHPDLAQKQALFLALWNDAQHVLWNLSKVLLAQEDKVVIGSVYLAFVALLRRGDFLFQNRHYDLFAGRVTLLFSDFECFDVRWSEADLSGGFRGRVWIIAPE